MSYAEAAASSGPTGANKLPSPPKVKQTSDPSGNVETVNAKEFEKLKKQGKQEAHDIIEKNNEKAKRVEEELEKLEREGKSILNKVIASLQDGAAQLSQYFNGAGAKLQSESCTVVSRTATELQNPVVVAQALVGVTGAIAGYFAYLERKRINTESGLVLGIHASVITGLVLADGYLFNKFYPKYDKKRL
ncbi:uncharacterized protein CANTADRAFT_56556 [Suhomyces tanzawaensis NRRL Y-17324]|uniref:Mitochondrial outer membrane protein OM14 C-terminal domain-containing protein n=1 Tax=Suhomyces tanzawaensis NRRL Y-17324 TaxID=984487 RepID=A0A1E4SDM0_9ASCO|nr:uncharacterized protein CANTADRAFT_56556 [Suhomyces tanzawaensis NRRL Y-17324]ODV77595.1 hypothetical protein CANTADRAFT_56556 [Suhomyces tanzawaensis NRRL Y-17324]